MRRQPPNREPAPAAPFILMGSDAHFSRAVLTALVAAGRPPQRLRLPTGSAALATGAAGPDLAGIGRAAGIPVELCGPSGTLDVEGCQAIVVACWPHRLPGSLLSAAPWGVLNLHPSLLPAFRGPTPLFWQLRAGVPRLGLTVHRMTERLDSGPILAQTSQPRPNGRDGPTLDRRLGALAAQLLQETLDALATGRARPHDQPPGGSYQGWPSAADFEVPTEWPLQRAWDFMVGTAEWGRAYHLLFAGSRLQTAAPVAMQPDQPIAQGWQWGVRGIEVGFDGGSLLFDPRQVRVTPA